MVVISDNVLIATRTYISDESFSATLLTFTTEKMETILAHCYTTAIKRKLKL